MGGAILEMMSYPEKKKKKKTQGLPLTASYVIIVHAHVIIMNQRHRFVIKII